MRRFKCVLPAVLLLAGGCQKVVKEIDTPGPAPPYDPKGAAVDTALVHPSENPPATDEKK